MNFKADTIADGFDGPQPSYNDKGEAGHVKWSRESFS